MICKKCGSDNQQQFSAEMNVHFPGREGLSKPTVMLFPQVVICLNCGFGEFAVSNAELQRLAMSTGVSK